MTSTRYVGRPWRSRFLRAPKEALELASRSDFVDVRDLATARLGLKTGADRFFYVRPLERVTDLSQLGNPRTRRGVPVEGLDGWQGRISASDLRPAILNPHELMTD